ncbi:AI-2E family transporter [Parasediminibacterium sp. JCM 36343]|uniref:AI-2E family transporter n=1 Tax=Parasediminibacterium sp. JCM 36343 TaxID=3374279 RepID=UPI00397CE2B2
MMKLPFYLKSTIILFGLILFAFIMVNLREILIPIAFSLLIAILLNPVCNWLERNLLPKVGAIAVSVILAIVVITGVAYFLTIQINGFASQMPLLKKKFAEMFLHCQQYAAIHFNMPLAKQEAYINNGISELKPYIERTLGNVVGSIAVIFLVPVYTFLFLYYKSLLLNFLYETSAEQNYQEVTSVLAKTKGAIQNYMMGIIIEAAIIASLNSITLFIFGIKYAILLGVIGAILNILPFVGGILGVFLPLVIATITKDGYGTQIGIIVSYTIIQFIDNHFIVPYVVSAQVKINALISIVIVLLGGSAWGLSGMFLSIPFIGVLKIIFDSVPELKSLSKLLGNEIPRKHKGEIWGQRRRKKPLMQVV